MTEAKGHTAVRAQKRPRVSDGEPWQKYELFPTPPWATRALFERVLPEMLEEFRGKHLSKCSARDPCAGLGHMSEVMAEYMEVVHASDREHYKLGCGGWRYGVLHWNTSGLGIEKIDFLDRQMILAPDDWFVFNPPFGRAAKFLERALHLATNGVAVLLRTQWLETEGRYRDVFTRTPPTRVAQFVERVSMCEGGWDPRGSFASSYAWFIWMRDKDGEWPRPRCNHTIPFFLIPPGSKKALTRESDALLAARFVPGFVPPSTLKKIGKKQMSLEGV
jgi:hypothetical protein